MTIITQSSTVKTVRIWGFGLVVLVCWVGVLASIVLIQQGIDLYPAAIG